ncbi:MAG TPA: hypothetical protein VE684_20405 [Crenalkalicoccus sp.]|nr:hypothetical protein [Crenalkalicoccus sp.]
MTPSHAAPGGRRPDRDPPAPSRAGRGVCRRAVLLAALATPALAAQRALVFHPARVVTGRAAAAAPGALVWLHGGYREGDPPATPAFLHRLTDAGWDLYRQERPPFGEDPLQPAAEGLAKATAELAAAGYRQVAVAGESRGAFVILVALSHPRLADAALLLAPAAHGPRPERRPLALAEYRRALEVMAPDAVRRMALVQFEGDPYDPDPPARREAFQAAMDTRHLDALALYHPQAPTGHGGTNDEEFDARWGACLTRFLDLRQAAPHACSDARAG